MRAGQLILASLGLVTACSSSGGSSSSERVVTETAASEPASPAADASAQAVTFQDPDTGFETADVHDADRQIMRFDAASGVLIWAENGERVSGWAAQGNDLRWSGSGVAFRVRFGTEAGERRAYFTEADGGTICNLEVGAAGQLSIFGTSELPPD